MSLAKGEVSIKQTEWLPPTLQLTSTVIPPSGELELPWVGTLGYLICAVNVVADQPVQVHLGQSVDAATVDLIPVTFNLTPTIARSLAALITAAFVRVRLRNLSLVPATVTLQVKLSPVGTPQDYPDQHKITAAPATLTYDANGHLLTIVKDLGVGVLFTKTFTWDGDQLVGISVWTTVVTP